MRMQMTVVVPTLTKMAILIFKVSDLEIFLILLSLGGDGGSGRGDTKCLH